MRLINADIIVENMEVGEKCFVGEKAVQKLLDRQPTAFDKEQVKKELKDSYERTVAMILDSTGSEFTIADFNIKKTEKFIDEIVDRGGVQENGEEKA